VTDKYRPGDYYLICEATGFKIRRSDAVMQWDGAWVHKDYCDVKHPLEDPREASKAYPVFPTRPEPTDSFITVPDAFSGDEGSLSLVLASGTYTHTGTDVTFTLSGGVHGDSILLEDGFYILLENGTDSILLES
jgi:hypothetical protein